MSFLSRSRSRSRSLSLFPTNFVEHYLHSFLRRQAVLWKIDPGQRASKNVWINFLIKYLCSTALHISHLFGTFLYYQFEDTDRKIYIDIDHKVRHSCLFFEQINIMPDLPTYI
jgi:hypothetical protein